MPCYQPICPASPIISTGNNYALQPHLISTAARDSRHIQMPGTSPRSLKIEHALEPSKQSNNRGTLIYVRCIRYDLRLSHEECHDLIGLSAPTRSAPRNQSRARVGCTACGLIILWQKLNSSGWATPLWFKYFNSTGWLIKISSLLRLQSA